MAQMKKGQIFSFLFVFFLCFASFIAGWLLAVWWLPGIGHFVEKKPSTVERPLFDEKEEDGDDEQIPFFEKLKDHVLFLFDPYKMDSYLRKNTHLEKGEGPIKKEERRQIFLKKRLFEPSRKAEESLPQNVKDFELSPPEGTELGKDLEKKAPSFLEQIQIEYDEKNKKQFQAIPKEQNIFARDGNFSFLINVFSEKKKAEDYFEEVKEKYPLWSFFLKAHKDHVRIYLGPFSSRQKALEFKQTQALPVLFSLEFIEEVSF